MNHAGKIILVLGATGQQGGAVARTLLKEGWSVRCLVRDPSSVKSKDLAKAGMTLIEGDFNDIDSLERAMEGCYGLFSVQNPMESGVQREIQQGIHIADTAKTLGIQHTVYSSVGGVEDNTGIPFFESKRKIEQHIHSIELLATCIRPVFFMENFPHFIQTHEETNESTLRFPLPLDTSLQLVAVQDIGLCCAAIFANPKEFIGKNVEILSDQKTVQEVIHAYTQVAGKRRHYQYVPIEQMRKQSKDAALLFEWLSQSGYQYDLKEMKLLFPSIHFTSFHTWLQNLQKYATVGF